MTQSALVIGATGQIGRQAVRALVEDGWEVTAASRTGADPQALPDGVREVRVDRKDTAALADALGDGYDVVVDTVAYDASDAGQLLSLADRIGSAVVISSAAVYLDDQGRSFDTQDDPDGQPRYPLPLPETNLTVPPGPSTYGTRKVELEQTLLAAADRLPATLLRAGAIHGTHSTYPRELHFVKRALDGRKVRILAYGGRSRFHPVHTSNLAELIRLAARRPGTRVLNAGDPHVPTVAEIATAIDEVLGHTATTFTIDGPPPTPTLGATPWSLAHPMVLDMSLAARDLDYQPPTTYEASLPTTVAWIADQLRTKDWREAFPRAAELAKAYNPYDYAEEDRWLATHGG
ncbi:NAD-dependent epimerase/dehydratase family protein [Actinacidiphila guanduensis]|uniref:Nucleoside-diphosphate-sugar epimerase n=1 Tax=Actinacidiphila guanduensis TaxID=310781 RepID=A0A1H0CDU0_9ACTN|nr:NAD-dependent epimerase/dehydratase family protein [Actinacidiphila guanduensis]SDN55986.1 Nucleoside-diphosphate-sugar epimerase [Actinacidiphila guanduensis]